MKYALYPEATHDSLAPQLAPAFRERLLATPKPGPVYTAIVFAGGRPVRGKLAERALAAAASVHPPPFVAIAESYTQEALAHLQAAKATILGLGDFVWTDETSDWARAVSAAGAKAPDVRKR